VAALKPRRKLTYKDYAKFRDDRRRHEVLDGLHLVAKTPMVRHQEVSGRLLCRLAEYLDEHAVGEVLPGPVDMLLSKHDILIPDIELTSTERAAIVKEENLQGPPDLVIEILNWGTRRRDLGVKRARYELLGVGEYWAVDPDLDEVWVYRREGAAFVEPLRLRAEAGDRLSTPLFPELEIDLRRVFKWDLPFSRHNKRSPGFRPQWAFRFSRR
jgi:Uma2 family endonuclease